MKIATKTLTSLLIVTVLTISTSSLVNATSNVGQRVGKRAEHRLERITKHHDRKMELQASVLGITPAELKEELKTSTFDQVLKRHGFKNRESFGVAMTGKLKDELKKRGVSEEKIQKILDKKMSKIGKRT
jgi:hypothetical protein